MYGVDRLKKLCEQEMLNAMTVETAAQILLAADERNAQVYILPINPVKYCRYGQLLTIFAAESS